MAVIREQLFLAMVAWMIMSSCQPIYGKDYFVGGGTASASLTGWSLYNKKSAENPHFFQAWSMQQTFVLSDNLIFSQNGNDSDTALRVLDPQYQYVQEEAWCNLFFTDPDDLTKINMSYTIQPSDLGHKLGFFSAIPNLCSDCNMYFLVDLTSPAPSPTPRLAGGKHSSHTSALIGVVAAAIGVTLIIGGALLMLLFVSRRRDWRRLSKSGGRLGSSTDSQSSSSQLNANDVLAHVEWPWTPQRFTYKELSAATKNFSSSQVLGEGGFGTVYKGVLRDSGSPVAVKRLSQFASQGAREFMAEVNIISQLRHRNLVQLLGWCDDKEELILVYEYMPNGDLDDLIYGYGGDDRLPEPLSWKQRYNVMCGVATALVYLHEEWEQRVVHRDVKTSNVMLDSQLNARLGDFGLARLSAHSQAPRTTLVAGTIGYLAPEFNLTGKATDKTDVYAFGVVSLEVSCARRPLTSNCVLVDWVWELHKEKKLLDAIDPKIDVKSSGSADKASMELLLQVGLLCCHPDPSARPSMRHVLNILMGESPLQKMPRSKPVAYFAEFGD